MMTVKGYWRQFVPAVVVAALMLGAAYGPRVWEAAWAPYTAAWWQSGWQAGWVAGHAAARVDNPIASAPENGMSSTFGYTTAGTAGEEYLYGRAFGSLFTSPSDCGDVTKISVYLNETYQNTSGRVAIYKHSDLSRVAIGDPVNYEVGGFRWIDFPITATLEPNTAYLLVFAGGFDGGIKYDTGDTDQGHICSSDVLWDPWDGPSHENTIYHSTKKFSIYATYTPTASNHKITGTVLDGASNPVSGVLVTATKGALTRTATTGDNGAYSVEDCEDGTWAVTPTKTGKGFSPASRDMEVAGADVTGCDFTAYPGGSISGKVTLYGAPLAGVLVEAGAHSDTTDVNGEYEITDLPAGLYLVKASKAGYAFGPTSVPVNLTS